ncbi:MAG TPA: hypothetical protein VNL98_05995 [Gemmatimonadales bacterium]|nr:hypothetical protein [Gemmatimonadales bacterium]
MSAPTRTTRLAAGVALGFANHVLAMVVGIVRRVHPRYGSLPPRSGRAVSQRAQQR